MEDAQACGESEPGGLRSPQACGLSPGADRGLQPGDARVAWGAARAVGRALCHWELLGGERFPTVHPRAEPLVPGGVCTVPHDPRASRK